MEGSRQKGSGREVRPRGAGVGDGHHGILAKPEIIVGWEVEMRQRVGESYAIGEGGYCRRARFGKTSGGVVRGVVTVDSGGGRMGGCCLF